MSSAYPLVKGEFEVPPALKSVDPSTFGTSWFRHKLLPLLRIGAASIDVDTFEGKKYVRIMTWQPGQTTVQYMTFASAYYFVTTYATLISEGMVGKRGKGFGLMALGKEEMPFTLFYLPWWAEKLLRPQMADFLSEWQQEIRLANERVSSIVAASQAMDNLQTSGDKAVVN